MRKITMKKGLARRVIVLVPLQAPRGSANVSVAEMGGGQSVRQLLNENTHMERAELLFDQQCERALADGFEYPGTLPASADKTK